MTELRTVRSTLSHAQQKQLLLYMAEKHRQLHIPNNAVSVSQFLRARAFYGTAFVLGFFSMEMIRFFNSPYTRFEDCMYLLEMIPELTKRYITFNLGFYSSQAIYKVIAQSLTNKLIAQNSGMLFNALSKHVQLSAAATKIWGKAFLRTTVSYAVGLMLNAILYSKADTQRDYWQQMFEYTGTVLVANTAIAPFFLKARHYVNELKYMRYLEPIGSAGVRIGKNAARTNFYVLFAIGLVEVVLGWDVIPAFFQDKRNAGKVEGALGWEMLRAQALLEKGEKIEKFPRRDQVICQQSLSELDFYTCVQQRLLADVKHYLLRRSLYKEIKDLKHIQYIESVYDTNDQYAEFLGRMGDDFKVINPFKVDRGYIPWERYKQDMHILMDRYHEYSLEFRNKYQNQRNAWMRQVHTTLENVDGMNVSMVNMIYDAHHLGDSVALVLENYERMAQDKNTLLFNQVYASALEGRDASNRMPHDFSLAALFSGSFGKKKQNYKEHQTISGKALFERLVHVANSNQGMHRAFNLYADLKPGELFKAYAYFLYQQEKQLKDKIEQNITDEECEKLQDMLAQLMAVKTEFEVLLSGWFNEIELPDQRSFSPASIHLSQKVAVHAGGVFNENGYPGLELMFKEMRGDSLTAMFYDDVERYFSELSKKEWPGLLEYGVESLESITHKFSTFSKSLSSRTVTLYTYGDLGDAQRIQKARVLNSLAARSANVLYEHSYSLEDQAVWDQIGLHIWDLLWINRDLIDIEVSESQSNQKDWIYQTIKTYSKENSPCRNAWKSKYQEYKHFFYDEYESGLTYLGYECDWDFCEQEKVQSLINPQEDVAWKVYDFSAISFQLFQKRIDQSLGISPQYNTQGNLTLSRVTFSKLLEQFSAMMNSFEQRYCM